MVSCWLDWEEVRCTTRFGRLDLNLRNMEIKVQPAATGSCVLLYLIFTPEYSVMK